jgi:POT family proton-dependent oligopeptide transporter
MKSLIMSLFLLTNAFGAALGAAIAPAAHDPNLEWLYIGLAITSLVGGCVFWTLYSRYNQVEDVLNELKSGSEGDNEVAPTLPMPYRVSKLEMGPMFKRSSTRPGTRQ